MRRRLGTSPICVRKRKILKADTCSSSSRGEGGLYLICTLAAQLLIDTTIVYIRNQDGFVDVSVCTTPPVLGPDSPIRPCSM